MASAKKQNKKTTKKSSSSNSLVQPIRFTRKTIWLTVLVIGVVGALLLIRSFAAIPGIPPTGVYVDSDAGSPGKATQWAKTYLGSDTGAGKAMIFEESKEKSTWPLIEDPGVLGIWKPNYANKMVIAVPMLPIKGINGEAPLTMGSGAEGKFNHHFQKLGENLVKNGMSDAVIRLGWEFNGDWYRWTAVPSAQNGNDSQAPQKFINYWKNVVATMRAVPNSNFQFDWNPTNGNGSNNFKAEAAWPGKDYVDIIGLDTYNQSWSSPKPSGANLWKEISGVNNHGVNFWIDFAKDPQRGGGKKISFPEWGTGLRNDAEYDQNGKLISPDHGGGDDPYFIEAMYCTMMSNAGNIAYNIYWDYPAPDYTSDFGSNPKAKQAFIDFFKNRKASTICPNIDSGGGTPSNPDPGTNPNPAPTPTVDLKANNADSLNLNLGTGAKLTWSSTNTTSCSAAGPSGSNWSGSQAIQNTTGVPVTPNTVGKHTYTLTCNGVSDKVDIQVSDPTTPVVNLVPKPASFEQNKGSSEISWSSTNASSCSATSPLNWNGGSTATSGKATVAPTSIGENLYKMVCTNANNNKTGEQTAKVVVSRPPVPPSDPSPEARFDITRTIKDGRRTKVVVVNDGDTVSGKIKLSIPKADQINIKSVKYKIDYVDIESKALSPSSTYEIDTNTRKLKDNKQYTIKAIVTMKDNKVLEGSKKITVDKPLFWWW